VVILDNFAVKMLLIWSSYDISKYLFLDIKVEELLEK
jgi:hypothetical protein